MLKDDNAEWVLMDYVNIVVHVFQNTIREYYNIELVGR
jgi:ribosome-associated protein